MSTVGNFGGWIMGLIFGLILSIMLEIYLFLRDDALASIDTHLNKYDKRIDLKFEALDDYKTVQKLLKELEIEFSSSSLTDLLNLSGTKSALIIPAFLLYSSIVPPIVAQDTCLKVFVLNHSQAFQLFRRSFDYVTESYWGTTYSKSDTWNLSGLDETLLKTKQLVESGKEVRRVFIGHPADPKAAERAKIQREKFKVDCKYIDINTIKSKLPLRDSWRSFWPDYLEESKIGKYVLLSPDFGIIDKKILISYLVDTNLNEIGAAIFFEPKFMDQIIEYHQCLFDEATYPS
jgi:hypothetical protein